MYILAIHGNFGSSEHDAAAVLLNDNKIVSAAEEERFIRYKHAVGLMPERSIEFCLETAGIKMTDVSTVAFPRSTWQNFDDRLKAYLQYKFGFAPPIEYVNHHLAHAASAFYISGFKKALIITIDQSGDGISCAVYRGNGSKIELVESVPFPNSLGLFAAFITQYLGFRSNHDEYKVMGLSSYGIPNIDLSEIITIKKGIVNINKKVLHPEVLKRYPVFHTDQLPMCLEKGYSFLPPCRHKNDPFTDAHKNLAASAQKAIEDSIMSIILKHKTSNDEFLCLAGGVAENSVSNGKIAGKNLFKDIYVTPACGDAGSALGAGLYCAVSKGYTFDKVLSNKWGSLYSNDYIQKLLKSYNIHYTESEDIIEKVANLLIDQNIIAWFQDKMEFGPRALGSRSLIADPSTEEMKVRVNNIKKREQFRPFAPSVLVEEVGALFEVDQLSPFMSFTIPTTLRGKKDIVAATHVDFTGRYQSVFNDGSLYRQLISSFYKKTNIPAVLNTSLNSGWEPIIESPEQALAFFYSSEATVLVIGNFIIKK